jgi:hypothetical protein
MLRQAGTQDRWVTERLGPWSLYVGRLDAIQGRLARAPLNTDVHPFVELSSAKNTARHAGQDDWTVAGAEWLELSREIWAARTVDATDETRAAAGGYALQSASTYWVAGKGDAAARALSVASMLLPDELFANAPGDATAVDVWPTR